MRNLPPTPANYAQRSGRAGRGGRPALVLSFSSYGNAHDQYFFNDRSAMIAGAVAPPRIDLANQELLEAHLHSVWLSVIGLPIKSNMFDVLDLDRDGYPLLEEVAASLSAAGGRLGEIVDAFRHVVSQVEGEIADAPWFGSNWVEDVARGSTTAFESAFVRWREMYRSAVQQRDAARRLVDSPRLGGKEREVAKQREREALREIDLLLNQGAQTESDFYPYRYLANEGFIPGYNFPRLPLRAFVATSDRAEAIDRPRFLGLSEFGPGNTLYHNGRKHRVTSCVLPAGGVDERKMRAKMCRSCGYIHPGESATVDLCSYCGTHLDASTSDFPQALFDQPAVRTSRYHRISAEEEERTREGFHITTHFRTTPGMAPRLRRVVDRAGNDLLDMAFLPQAELWRINHGWRRAANRHGFVLDPTNGRWLARDRDGEDEEDPGPTSATPVTGLMPVVRDTRNLLLLRVLGREDADEAFLKTFAHAIRRAIQLVYQVEEQEVAVELIGQEDHQRIMLWEAAEGGIGIWDRLIESPLAIAELASQALKVTHIDPETGEEKQDDKAAGCTAACYDCLLSYANQPDHRFMDRSLILEYLMELRRPEFAPEPERRGYDEQYAWLLERVDPESSFERAFLDHLHDRQMRLPDRAQNRPSTDVAVQPDFYYERDGVPGICVFIDGPHHDAPKQAEDDRTKRASLEDAGFRVVAIRHDRTIGEQVEDHGDVF